MANTMFSQKGSSLVYTFDSETLTITPWGPSGLRVRATHESSLSDTPNALTEPIPPASPTITITSTGATIHHDNLVAEITSLGKVTVKNSSTSTVLLEEFHRTRQDVSSPAASALRLHAREFIPRPGCDAYRLTARFESLDPDEKLYGMGQYQQPQLNLKGSDLELAQRNSQASVPFVVSSRGYGFLWNQPAVGRVVFGKNRTTWEAYSTRALDYWVAVAAGGGVREVVRAYGAMTGRAPLMPSYGLGFWQCKLRYQTQDELLAVAREHVARGVKPDVLVVDYFHWPLEGEWKFDKTFWPDPQAMIDELRSLGIELMVSVWPTVDQRSENYRRMLAGGMLVRQDRGLRISMGPRMCIHFDATNPAARSFVWDAAKRNYYDMGIRVFWLDEAEPEYTAYDFDVYRYHLGPDLMVGNIYPLEYARGFYEGMKAAGQGRVVNLVRCAWAGSQKYGVLLWSGDIASSWASFRNQLSAGLNVGMAGIPWWTTDIGGFHGGDPKDPAFRELFVRWFQWGAFCPVMRNHGDRLPQQPRLGNSGGSHCLSGAPNEIWSYGDEVYEICKIYLALRGKMKEYVESLMIEAHEQGDPVMRTLFYEFPDDPTAWEVEDQYLFGHRYLVAPIFRPGQRERSLWLPKGAAWRQISASGEVVGDMWEGGQRITVDCPLGYMPVFERL
ncbi:glycosyl hydrolases family 31-domain-containing protein [Echria macrotheca]|uniref:Glycosyl hydrolases family 31-domain-containing protein n=1 Tax=Echria macrotheca TaxID=438768 RepID=A0AAJ0B8X8_9PEZI|nr:glycosyl hydrolases family 31-domain-containing protein [Echria macrotheca]